MNFPRVLGNFTDELKDGLLSFEGIARYSWTLLGIGVGFAVLGGIGQYLVMYTGRYFEFMNRRRLFVHFTGLSEKFYSKNGVGKLLSYFMNDVTTVRESISMGVNQTANATMLLVSTIVMLLITNVPFYLVAASIAPLLFIPVIVVWLGPMIRRRSLQVQEALGVMTESAEEQFGGMRVTKKFAVEETMKGRFGATVDSIRNKQLRLIRVSSLFQSIIPFLGASSLIIALSLGGYLTIMGRITVGNFVALTLYIRMLMNPLQQIGNVINVVQRARASLDRLNDLLGKQADIKEVPDAKELDLENAKIEVRGLSFSYDELIPSKVERARDIFHRIDLDVPAGSTLGIIGRTGSGKTTLMKLLLRTYDPPPGTVLIGGVDIRNLTLKSLREGIAYVPQDGFLFSSTIRENIAFYNRDTDTADVEEAARKARVYDNIAEFPDQFETRLGERGLTLSGGQRQRTSLARGIIKQAPILILDDSVSAVDAVTETEIMETIRDIRQGKTTIIIAHRISALKHADEIIVLDQGKIVQRGTHAELLQGDGLYRTLHDIQEEGMRHHAQAINNWQMDQKADLNAPQPKPNISTFKALSGYMKEHRLTFAGFIGCTLIAISAELLQPYLMKIAIDDNLMVGKNDFRGLMIICGIYFMLSLLSMVFTYLQNNLLQKAGQSIVASIRKRLFAHISKLSMSYFDKVPSGSLITHVSSDTEAINQFFNQVLLSLFRDGFTLVFILFMMFQLDVTLTLYCLILLPIIAGIAIAFRRYMRHTYQMARTRLSRLVAFVARISRA